MAELGPDKNATLKKRAEGGSEQPSTDAVANRFDSFFIETGPGITG
jgi:hypothetical protein